MEKDDKGSTLIRIGVSGESSCWYRPTRVVPDQRPLNGRCKRSLPLKYDNMTGGYSFSDLSENQLTKFCAV